MEDSSITVPADNFKFEDLCNLLEELYKIHNSSRKAKKEEQDKTLFNFMNNFRINAASISGQKNCTFFPILRLLLPDLERERSPYNLKESKLGHLLVKVLSLHKNSSDAKTLLNFRAASSGQQGSDFPAAAYYVLKNRVDGSGELTIKDINDALDKISNAEIGNKGPILDEVFSYIIMNTTPQQQKWFLRIVLKDLKLGMGRNRILTAFHPDAAEHYEICSSIHKVCEELDDGIARPLELGIQLFSAVSPMLSERLDLLRIGKLPQSKTFQIETKFDGERFQMHMSDGKFEYFSRKGFNYSEKYGKTYESDGLLTPFLNGCFKPEVKSFILDGEMMGWHKDYRCFGSKGMSYDIKKITNYSKFRPCYCAFDLLYYNGKALVGPPEKGGVPLCDRLKLLDGLFADIDGVIYRSKRDIVGSSSDIVNALNDANEKGEEGIVVKEVDSYYLANKRNAGWYKVKPEYTEGTMEDLDLVIVGGDYAADKRQGLVNSYLVALVDKAGPGDKLHRWLCVGRVSTGLSYDEREQLNSLLEAHWKVFEKAPSPENLIWNKVKPDLWVHPEKSVVLQVRASELIRSKDFATDYTLRFPRVLKVREDKPVKDSLTLEEFNDLIKERGPVVKLSTGQVNPEDVETASTEVRMRRKRQAKPLEVADHFKPAATDPSPVTSQALKGRKICVLSDDEDSKKQELESLVLSHGGIVVQNIGADTWCCVAGRKTLRVMNAIDALSCDIVKTVWLRSLPKTDELCPLPSPLHMMAATKQTQLALALRYDRYGDSYTEPVDEEVLVNIFNKMDEDSCVEIYLTTDEMLELDQELFHDVNPFFLRDCFMYCTGVRYILSIKAQMHGATLCELTSSNLTHVVVPTNRGKDCVNFDVKKIGKHVSFVSEEWLEKCLLENRKVPEADFLI